MNRTCHHAILVVHTHLTCQDFPMQWLSFPDSIHLDESRIIIDNNDNQIVPITHPCWIKLCWLWASGYSQGALRVNHEMDRGGIHWW